MECIKCEIVQCSIVETEKERKILITIDISNLPNDRIDELLKSEIIIL